MLTTDYIIIGLLVGLAFIAWRILQTILALKTSVDGLRQTIIDESVKQTSTLDLSLKSVENGFKVGNDALRQTIIDESAKQTSTLDSSLKTIDKSLHETIDVL